MKMQWMTFSNDQVSVLHLTIGIFTNFRKADLVIFVTVKLSLTKMLHVPIVHMLISAKSKIWI